MITKKDIFFCYNANVAKFIKAQGIYSITTAIEPTTKKMFTLFPKGDNLQQALDLYKKSK
ncbi:hypothetical protein ACFSTA_19115 [Ornithinibacillus salinisoli]|uniref:DUF5659 domain-containing protein n=1 Tax=Ornithinibacillus salinisoli TaxID=1848459 RepID=A0ABW4W3Y0_9BACI